MKKINNILLIVLVLLAILSILGLFRFEAHVFDVFGLIVFSFLVFISIWMLITKKETPDIIAWIILSIGILGILVDGGIILKILIG